jgi:hypothetical protein
MSTPIVAVSAQEKTAVTSTTPPLKQNAPEECCPLYPRRYSLVALVALTFVAPPILAVLWFFTRSITAIVGLALFVAFFWIRYWILLKSQSFHPRTGGDQSGYRPRSILS